jgi:hypothetical protein
VPRESAQYSALRREVAFFGLPIANQLPQIQPQLWETAPKRFKHARIVVEEGQKIIEWEEGILPVDLNTKMIEEIIRFFGNKGYQISSEYASKGSRLLTSIWMVKEETYSGADVPLELSDSSRFASQIPAMVSNKSVDTGAGGGGGMSSPQNAVKSVANLAPASPSSYASGKSTPPLRMDPNGPTQVSKSTIGSNQPLAKTQSGLLAPQMPAPNSPMNANKTAVKPFGQLQSSGNASSGQHGAVDGGVNAARDANQPTPSPGGVPESIRKFLVTQKK